MIKITFEFPWEKGKMIPFIKRQISIQLTVLKWKIFGMPKPEHPWGLEPPFGNINCRCAYIPILDDRVVNESTRLFRENLKRYYQVWGVIVR